MPLPGGQNRYMGAADQIHVEVVYAQPEQAHLIALQLPAGSTIMRAIQDSGVLQRCPEINLALNKVGIFGKLKDLDTVLREGDRVEIYRSLRADPKEARRQRVENKRQDLKKS